MPFHGKGELTQENIWGEYADLVGGGAPTGPTTPKPPDEPGYIWIWTPPDEEGYGGGWEAKPARDGGGAGAAASMYGAELDYALGLKGLEVDWEQVAVERERIAQDAEDLAEITRANAAREREDARRRHLDAATEAVDAYLRGTELADARKLNAFQESRELLPYLVSPSQRYFSGQEPGGPLATAAGRFGLPFTGAEIQHKQLTPAQLGLPPSPAFMGSEVLEHAKTVGQAGYSPREVAYFEAISGQGQ